MKFAALKKTAATAALLALSGASVFAAPPVVRHAGPAPVAAATAKADDLFSMLPNSDSFAVVNVQQLLNSLIYKMAKGDPNFQKSLDEVEAKARTYGIDFAKIESVAIVGVATSIQNGAMQGAILATGDFNKDQLLGRLKENAETVSVKSEPYGNDTIFTISETGKAAKSKVLTNDDIKGKPAASASVTPKSDVSMSFLNDRAVVLGDKASVIRTLDTRSGKHPSLSTNKELVSAFEGTNSSAAIRFVTAIPESARAELKKMANGTGMEAQVLKPLVAVTSLFGTVDFSNGFKLDTTMRTPSAAEGKPLFDGLTGLLSLGRMFLDPSKPDMKALADILNGIALSDKGADVQLSISLTEEAIKALTESGKKTNAKPAQ